MKEIPNQRDHQNETLEGSEEGVEDKEIKSE